MAEVVDSDYQGSAGDDAMDVTARLQRLEHQFAETQRLAQFGSWEWDLATDVVTWSDELYRICGVEPGTLELTVDAVISQYHPDDRAMVAEAVQRAIAEKGSWALDARLVRPDGHVRWLHSRGRVILDGHGEPQGFFGVAIDITERRHSEKFLRDFIGNAAHAIGTPAAVILQSAHVFAESTLGTAEYELALGALLRQSKRLQELWKNLFDLVALDKDAPSVMFGLSMLLKPVPLADRVQRAAAASPRGDGATLTIDIGADLAVVAEPSELERVFVNLFAHAQTHGGPHVVVTAHRLDDEVIVEVRDDGPGVPSDEQPSLFAPFAKRRASGSGDGLGLAIAHQLMHAFGGAISFENADPRGAVFTLRFSVA